MGESIRLDGPTDFAGFRAAARGLLARGVPPAEVRFDDGEGGPDLFADSADGARTPEPHGNPEVPGKRPAPVVSRAFVELAGAAALHADPDRFQLLYGILWRLADEPGLLSLASDPAIVRLTALAKAVRRDIHKMHAFVRFREIETEAGDAFVAWYEPDHHVVEAASPFFARRFASLLWTILTPRRSVHWTGDKLVFAPGARQADAPSDDALEALWRTYYAHIFNPARVNTSAMKAELPVRFWKNLPEARLIADLVATAPRRAERMIAAMPTDPVRRRGADAPVPIRPTPAQDTLAGVAEAAAGCRACPLWEQATQTVPGEGAAGASIMLVGEQPGDEEDIAGRPFVGPAGQLLDRALGDAGLDRRTLYLTNAVKHFKFAPRGKKRIHKRPDAGEIHACLPWLMQEVALVRPKVVVMLGVSAALAVLGRAVAVTQERGQPFRLASGEWGLIATHPAFVLRLPDRGQAEEAYQRLVSDLTAAAKLAQKTGVPGSQDPDLPPVAADGAADDTDRE